MMRWSPFESLGNLWLLIPILFLIWLYVRYYFWQRATQNRFADRDLLKRLTLGGSKIKFVLKAFLFCLALILLAIAMLKPTWGTEKVPTDKSGSDVVFALDLSNSMLAKDIVPNRFEKAKQILEKTIDRLAYERVSLLVFAYKAHLLLPFTTDHLMVKNDIEQLQPSDIRPQGTDIQEALHRAMLAFDEDKINTRQRYIVLLTDGEEHQGDLLSAAEQLKKRGIRLCVVLFGTEKGSAMIDAFLNNQLKTNSKGDLVITKMQSNKLEALVKKNGGVLYKNPSTQTAADNLALQLVSAQKANKQDVAYSIEPKNQYQVFVWIAFCALLLEALFFYRSGWFVFKPKR